MAADNLSLKEIKKAYKKARLLPEEGDVSSLEKQLKGLLDESAWVEFSENVEVFLGEARRLGEEVDAKARDRRNIMIEPALSPYLERAKTIGCGAQKYLKQIFDRAVAERDAARAAERPPETAPMETFYPCLPREWVPRFYFKGSRISPDRLFDVAMNDYCFFSLWEEGEQRDGRLRELQARARQAARPPGQFDEAMAKAEFWLGHAIPVAREAVRRLSDDSAQAEVIEKLGEPLIRYVKTSRKKMTRHKESVAARNNHVVHIKGVENVAVHGVAMPEPSRGTVPGGLSMAALSTHPNDITTLAPGNAWTVYLDEAYYGKDEDFETGGVGIMAGVICRDDNPLPLMPCLHCSTDSTEERLTDQDKALQEILHHPNCGVLAIPTSAYDVAMGWDDALAAWVDVVVRLLPFPEGDKTVSLRICVEPHDPYRTAQDLRALKLVCEKSLKDSFPERARRVTLSFEPLPKPRSGERSGNAYPDIIGFTCLRRKGDSTARQRYFASGWSGVCHLDLSVKRISTLLRCFYKSDALDAATWSALVSGGGAGIAGAISTRFGERARSSADEWELYLEFLHKHLVSGAIDMKVLRDQVEWLRKFKPLAIQKKSQIVWLTAQIALANHEGKIAAAAGSPLRIEFDALCSELYDEAAPLVCDATLNLVVAYTNCYEFDMALALIQSLLEKDCALVGLSGYGKLLSTEGQHLAFLGMVDKSIASFNKALDCFARLSDEKERAINLDITRAYLATVTMDGRPDGARRALALYLLGDGNPPDDALVREAGRLATERSAKFHHHILLRYIVSLPADDPLREAYCRQKWCEPSVGHPWEMIEFYRALLLPPGPERELRLETAYRLAVVEGGETLMVIAAVIAGAALADGLAGEWQDRFSRMVEKVKDISGLGEQNRLQVLLDQPRAKLPPLALAGKVLPFNFR